ncbi:MAG: hypothetical protein HPY78_09030 [Brevinematales bacterium]|nr:hypothetical protein [Brevinematales bacterium]
MWRSIALIGCFLFSLSSLTFSQNLAVLYFYRADPVRNVSGADIFMVDHIATNVIRLTRKYEIVTRETIGEYLLKRGITNAPTNVTPAMARENASNWGFSDVVEVTFSPAPKAKSFEITLRIWNALEKRYIREEKIPAQSGRDIFGALDPMSLALAESLTGKRLGFGTLRVATTLKDSIMYIDGIEYETSSIMMENAIAGLTHSVIIGYRKNNTFVGLYTNNFEIKDGFTYDLTYHHEEWVEVIDLRTNTNRIPKGEYRPAATGQTSLHIGPSLRIGNMSLVWAGAYLTWQSLVFDLSLGYTPRITGMDAGNVYMHTIGLQSTLTLRLFDYEESLWNTGLWLSASEFAGVYPFFVFYNKGWPVFSTGLVVSLRWGFSWVPSWLRSLEIDAMGGMAFAGNLYPLIGFSIRY